MLTEARAWQVLQQVPDPELPAVSICDLGIVREVRAAEDGVTVVFPDTPTRARSMSLGTVVVICVKLAVAVEPLYLPLLTSIGLVVSTPTKLLMPPVAGRLALKVQR